MVLDERLYYQEILRISKANFMVLESQQLSSLSFPYNKSSPFIQLYPYHISDVLVRGLRITPFKYYLDMMHEVMQNGTKTS